jgi:hypothetical protein
MAITSGGHSASYGFAAYQKSCIAEKEQEMQQVDGQKFLGVEDDGVDLVLRLAVKALSEAYGMFYDHPQNLPGGWIGFRVDVGDRDLRVVPKRNACNELQRLLDRNKSEPQ